MTGGGRDRDANAGNGNAGNRNAGNGDAGNDSVGDGNGGNQSVGDGNAGNDSVGAGGAGNGGAGNDSVGNDSVGDDDAGNGGSDTGPGWDRDWDEDGAPNFRSDAEGGLQRDAYGRDDRGRLPGEDPHDENFVDPDQNPFAGEIAAATADLDDDAGLLVPHAPPLSLPVVEAILNRRWPETRIEPTLARISALLDLLGNPHRAYPVIHIAGTNGKTSVSRMVDALLTRMGLRTGRFTSPHLQTVTERISIDGAPIDEDRYTATYADVAPYITMVDEASHASGGVELSKFEILTAMAFAAFADAPVEVGVIEVGLGGTWDCTNVADGRVAVITPIGIDHTAYLGDTITEIAGNKAGIIKAESVAVIGPQVAEAMTEVLRRAVAVDATVARAGSEFSVLERAVAVGGQRLTLQGLGGVYPEIFLPLHGPHQAANAAVALAAVEAFFGAGAGKQLDVAAVQDAFAAVSSPGRLERIGTSPTILIDAGHNPHGATALAAALAEEFSFTRLVGVLAVMADKDVEGILRALSGTFDEVVVTVNSSPRSMPVVDLAEVAIRVLGEERVHTSARLESAIDLAVDLATAAVAGGDGSEPGADAGSATGGVGVLITGSVVTAGDARSLAGLVPA